MIRTFDVLSGDIPNETVAEAIEKVTEPAPDIDVAALVARFNDFDAKINKIESQLNDLFKSQVDATKDAVQESSEVAEDDNPGETSAEEGSVKPDNSKGEMNNESE